MPAPTFLMPPTLALAKSEAIRGVPLARTPDASNIEARVAALEAKLYRQDQEDAIWRRLHAMGLRRPT